MRIKKTIERWFDVPDDSDGGRLRIRELLPGEVTDIFDKVFVQKINYKKGEGGEFEPAFSQNTNKSLDRKLTLTKTIVNWENFFDSDGKEMKCTPDNIMRASREIKGFNELVTELREKLAKEIEKEKEDQQKNLLSSVLEPVK